MPVTLTRPLQQTESDTPPHKLWTREDCVALEKAGLLELRRYELIEGELIRKMPKNLPHTRALGLLIEWLMAVFKGTVLQEPAIDVSPEDTPTNEPEPDAVVLVRPVRELTSRIRPEDMRLVVEVSDTTLAFDLKTKAALYARAGIPEYWVLDVKGRRLIAHRDPAQGQYESIVSYSEEESVAALAAPGSPLRVGDVL